MLLLDSCDVQLLLVASVSHFYGGGMFRSLRQDYLSVSFYNGQRLFQHHFPLLKRAQLFKTYIIVVVYLTSYGIKPDIR